MCFLHFLIYFVLCLTVKTPKNLHSGPESDGEASVVDELLVPPLLISSWPC